MTATFTKSAFRQAVEVAIDIAAPAETVWGHLVNAAAMPTWNSTVESIAGPIELGQKLAIRVPAAPGRVFHPTVTEFDPPHRMVWSEGNAMFRGVRTYTVEPVGSGSRFTMGEVYTGAMLPMIRGSLPDSVPIFDRYAADLKAVSER